MAAAQNISDGYQITAKTSGIKDTTVYLISCTNDTLGTTEMKNGMFFFKGKLAEPNVAYVRPAGTQAVIPLLLENTNFQIMAGEQGVKIVGGELQAQYERYSAISQKTGDEQARVQKEMQAAMQEGNKMKMQGLQNEFMKFVEKVRKEELAAYDSMINTIPGFYALSVNMNQMPRDMVRERFDRFNETYQNHPLGKAVVVVGDIDVKEMEQRLRRIMSVVPKAEGECPLKDRYQLCTVADHDTLRLCDAHYEGAKSRSVIVINRIADTPDDAERLKGKIAEEWNKMAKEGVSQAEYDIVARHLNKKMTENDDKAENWAKYITGTLLSNAETLNPVTYSQAIKSINANVLNDFLKRMSRDGNCLNVTFLSKN